MKRKAITFLILIFTIISRLNSQPPIVAEKDKVAYLFAYFTGNRPAEEAIHFALSLDGYRFSALNCNKPVIDSEKISSSGGVRDPHIIRGEDGKTFYMVCTDMRSSLGWTSNRAMVLLKSTDLIDWSSSVVNIEKKYPGQENLLRVWAPQTIYDNEAGKYLIYWSMKHGEANDIIYYAYANEDFTDLEGGPKPFFVPKSGDFSIDGDIVKKDSLYYLYRKTGNKDGSGIKVATTHSLTSGEWTEYDDRYVEPTEEDVEGSGMFKLNNSDTYIMMFDLFRKHDYQFSKTTDMFNFSMIPEEIKLDFKPRHGSVVSITRSELRSLLTKWGAPDSFPAINNNPVLEGYYADPDVLYSNKTGKYYIYPTSDGFTNWMGSSFKAFSSDDLVNWEDEGVILDFKDVSWAEKRAWAPCIIEKKMNGEYKYFYYYTGEVKIGVAVSDSPTGPFTDSGKPLLEERPEGVNRGIVIDPDVFTDPKTNKSYLYWGNGWMAGAELNDDMVSIKKETMTLFKPTNYREGTYVFYRNGIYYFSWSEGDTRSEDYRVRYATASSPLGKLNIPEDNLVIAKYPEKSIYGTGHHSILQVPGKDEWYIVYHRFNYPKGIEMGRAAGYHREVCIDRLEFNEDGSIKRTIPTHNGIKLKTM